MACKAFIAGCASPMLSPEEARFFKREKPWGFILFKRNIDTPDQVRKIVDDFRDAVGRADAPILIDQEGGRVQRLQPPHWPKYPSSDQYGRLMAKGALHAREIARLGGRLIAHDLKRLGITVDCLPVLDVPVAGAHDVIGSRAYSRDPDAISLLGRAAAEGLIAGGVLPVIKHIPGHGRAGADSHHKLPVVDASRAELEANDFRPFRALADMPLAMTAHIVYSAIDKNACATVSKKMFRDVIRGHIGYGGLVMSDDLSMKALGGSFKERTIASLSAGCDVVLHCNGVMDEMKAVAMATPELAGKAKRRAEAALLRICHDPEPFDPVDGRAKLDVALAALP